MLDLQRSEDKMQHPKKIVDQQGLVVGEFDTLLGR